MLLLLLNVALSLIRMLVSILENASTLTAEINHNQLLEMLLLSMVSIAHQDNTIPPLDNILVPNATSQMVWKLQEPALRPPLVMKDK
jgi:hypothetical protein